jgi:hypothetical protein
MNEVTDLVNQVSALSSLRSKQESRADLTPSLKSSGTNKNIS